MFSVKILGACPEPDRETKVRQVGDDRSQKAWRIPEEFPVAFIYNRRNYAVMLATPQDMVDFAVGFSLTEGVVDNLQGIESLEVAFAEIGVDLRLRISDKYLERFDLRQRRRNLMGVAGCGVCGVENKEEFFTKLPSVGADKVTLSPPTIAKAIAGLAGCQPLNQRTRSVHGAAWVSLDGNIRCLREDVGRHNALDKLLGALALSDVDMTDGFVLMSSRCSYELIEKAARRGVRAMVSISAPTGFAAAKAREANMSLYARDGEGAVEVLS